MAQTNPGLIFFGVTTAFLLFAPFLLGQLASIREDRLGSLAFFWNNSSDKEIKVARNVLRSEIWRTLIFLLGGFSTIAFCAMVMKASFGEAITWGLGSGIIHAGLCQFVFPKLKLRKPEVEESIDRHSILSVTGVVFCILMSFTFKVQPWIAVLLTFGVGLFNYHVNYSFDVAVKGERHEHIQL